MKTFSTLDDFLPYLIRRINGKIEEAVFHELQSADLTIEKWRILVVLHQLGSQNLSNLSQHTSINNSTLSRLVGRMQEEGLICREPRPTGRSVMIDLLPLGEAKLKQLMPLANEIEAMVTARFSAVQFKKLKKTLTEIYEMFDELAERYAGDDRQDSDNVVSIKTK